MCKSYIVSITVLFALFGAFDSVSWEALSRPGRLDKPQHAALSWELINYVNYVANTTWRAGSTDRFQTIEDVKRVLGVLDPRDDRLPQKTHGRNSVSLPLSFDARTRWPKCRTIKQIRNQGHCGSCWAFGAVESMSDRICIHSNGTKQFELSAQDLLTCCTACGSGCGGGIPDRAWRYWVTDGIVTGGAKGSHSGCIDYTFADPKPDIRVDNSPLPCVKQCQPGYPKTYAQDKHYGKFAYSIPANQQTIMNEIYANGPVEVVFDVYADFMSYKRGVYQHVTGALVGLHAVKMLGWGIDNGTPYWLMANSWGPKWGNEGYFNILRGANECKVESWVVAGLPR